MNVGELIAFLENFPPEFPIYIRARPDGFDVWHPGNIVLDLVSPKQLRGLGDDETHVDGVFFDSVVVEVSLQKQTGKPNPE